MADLEESMLDIRFVIINSYLTAIRVRNVKGFIYTIYGKQKKTLSNVAAS